LVRTGPVGTMVGVTFSCPRCGYRNAAEVMHADAVRVLNDPRIRAALR
jgi:C4-type Zn-finger protein